MNGIITRQTFKDNATAHAPLFLKWFQLRSNWSIVSFAANNITNTHEKLKYTIFNQRQNTKTTQNLFFKRHVLMKYDFC